MDKVDRTVQLYILVEVTRKKKIITNNSNNK